MAAGSTHAALASIIREADPAAQISTQLVDCLAAEMSPLFENLAAVYGRETDPKELLYLSLHIARLVRIGLLHAEARQLLQS